MCDLNGRTSNRPEVDHAVLNINNPHVSWTVRLIWTGHKDAVCDRSRRIHPLSQRHGFILTRDRCRIFEHVEKQGSGEIVEQSERFTTFGTYLIRAVQDGRDPP